MTEVITRIAIDWDGDLFICYDALPTDALNILPSPLYYTDMDIVGVSSGTFSHTAGVTAYGIQYQRVVTGTGVFGGIRYGFDNNIVNDIAVSPSTTYRMLCWVRGVSGSYGTTPILMQAHKQGTPPALGSLIVNSSNLTLTADWQQLTASFTTDGSTSHIAIGIIKSNNANNITFDVAGLMLVAGTGIPAGFNVGDASNGHDVITDDVRTADWTLGKSNWLSLMPAEGIATLSVNNDSRKYSPEYASSPLYGQMQQKRLITIDVWKPSTSAWVRKFAGWTRRYLPAYGQNRDNVTTITCEQGMFRLREIRYRQRVTGTATADTIIQQALFDGFVSPMTPLQCLLDNARLNANAYFVDPAAIMTLDTGVSEIDLNGEAWGERDSVEQVIAQLMGVERGWFFLQGDGRVRFYNRDHYPALTPVAFDIDHDAIDGDYRHSEAFYNVVQLTHYPFTLEDGEIVYLLRQRIALSPNRSKEIQVRFEREEGKRFEVESINSFDGSVNGSTLTAETQAGVDQSAKVKADFAQTDGRSGILTIKNSGGAQRRVTYLALKGTVRESYGGQMVEVVSENGTVRGAYILQENTKLVTTEVDADNLARYLLHIHETARGEFDSISLISRDDTLLGKMLDNGVGSKISVSETQTAHSGEYVVIGESHQWQSKLLRTAFKLENLARRPNAWICGTSALGVDTHLAY